MIFHISHFYDGYERKLKSHDPKLKMAIMPIYGKDHSKDFFSRTSGPIWLIFWKHIGHLPIK